MFGITFDKLLLIGIVAAFLLGPERLPGYAEKLGGWVRRLREFSSGASERIREEMGPEFEDVDWKKLDPRQYDPRRIIRDALLDDPAPANRAASTSVGSAAGASSAAMPAVSEPDAVAPARVFTPLAQDARAPFDGEAT